jgi:hypothetical protein
VPSGLSCCSGTAVYFGLAVRQQEKISVLLDEIPAVIHHDGTGFLSYKQDVACQITCDCFSMEENMTARDLDLQAQLKAKEQELKQAQDRIKALETEIHKIRAECYHDNYYWSVLTAEMLANNVALNAMLHDTIQENICRKSSEYHFSQAEAYLQKLNEERQSIGLKPVPIPLGC